MNPLLSCQSIVKAYGSQPLFSDISLTINEGERLGLIGPNGSGKSTFLQILAGIKQPDQGEISFKKEIRVEYLAQEDSLQNTQTIHEVLWQRLAGVAIEEQEKYARIQRWLARAEIKDSDRKVNELSGGWRKRLNIIASLIMEPQLLLLDEPTNHLDIEGICWLEQLLQNPAYAFILVTHDRYFLENVSNKIVELNRQFPKGYIKVEGSYSDYLIHREAALDNQLQLETVLANKLRRETEWLNRGPKARATKARFRIDEAYQLRNEHSEVRKRNNQGQSVGFDFDGTQRKTKKLIEAKEISKTVGGQELFSSLNLTLSPGTCIGLLGRNGTGKSTLISILNGAMAPDGGTIKWADDLKIVLFDQNRYQLDHQLTLKEALSPTGDSVVFQGRSIHVMSWAKRFLFEADKLELPVAQLSGGEQARILIANLMLKPADVLLLDEPTNDLDIPSLEVLEKSIEEFPGVVVLVTHDRYMLDRLASSVIGFDGQGQALSYADYNQWLETLKKQADLNKTGKEKKLKTKQTVKKLTYKEEMELAKIEENILCAEQELETCQSQMEKPEILNDPERLQQFCSKLQVAQEKVEHLYTRWEVLEAAKSSL